MTWEEQTKTKIELILEQIMAWGAAMAHEDRLPPLPAQAQLLNELYEHGLPLARLLDRAHLVLHAEGPGAASDGPRLSALNWLASTSEKVMKTLSAAWIELQGADSKRLIKRLDLRLAGMAPGSLWMGFRIEPPAGDLLPEDTELVAQLAQRIGMLPEAARFIDDEGLRPGIEEAMPDPAERDVLLESLLRLAPTGRAGIHTLEVASGTHGSAALSNRERVVLREALAKPYGRDLREVTLQGEVRAADLDKTRIVLRTTEGALRCVLTELTAQQAKTLIGEQAHVGGRAAHDRHGRPRLLFVERIEPIATQKLL